MIGLDTNVLVRYVTQDDRAQSAAATKLIDSLSAEEPGFITVVAAVELVWVLQSCYSVRRDKIVQALETLLRSQQLVIERAETVWQAVRRFATGKADFADCLIERCSHASECNYTATFDQKAAAAGMRLIG